MLLLVAANIHPVRGQDPTLTLSPPLPETDKQIAGPTVAHVGDLNGDGAPDVLVGMHGLTPDGEPTVPGRVYVYSGEDGELLDSIEARDNDGAGFGASLTGVGDVDDDSVNDFVVGSFAVSDSVASPLVVSGASLKPIRSLDFDNEPSDVTSTRVNTNPDAVSLDAGPTSPKGDEWYVAVGTPGSTNGNEPPQVAVFSLPSGDLVYRRTSPTSVPEPFFGNDVAVVEDVNDDGTADLLVASPIDGDEKEESTLKDMDNLGRAYVIDGATGDSIYTLSDDDIPTPSNAGPAKYRAFGASVSQAPDVDGDGVADLAVGRPSLKVLRSAGGAQGSISFAGKAAVFSGGTGEHLKTLEQEENIDPDAIGETHSRFGAELVSAGDVNGDGASDLLLSGDDGALFVMDGATGEQLAGLEAGSPVEVEMRSLGTPPSTRTVVPTGLAALPIAEESGGALLVRGGLDPASEPVRLYDSGALDISERTAESEEERGADQIDSKEMVSWLPETVDGRERTMVVPDDTDPIVIAAYGDREDEDQGILNVILQYGESLQQTMRDSLEQTGGDLQVREFEGTEVYETQIQINDDGESIIAALFPEDFMVAVLEEGPFGNDEETAKREELRTVLKDLYTEHLVERIESSAPDTP